MSTPALLFYKKHGFGPHTRITARIGGGTDAGQFCLFISTLRFS